MSENNLHRLNNSGHIKKMNSHKKPKDNKKFENDDSDEDIQEKKIEDNKNIELQIEKMHIQLEKLRQTKKDLENDNEYLNYKINNLKKIIKRIQDEED